MVTAARRAAELRANLRGKVPYELKTEDYEKIGIALGLVEGAMDIANTASEALSETWNLLGQAASAADHALDDVEHVSQIKNELKNVFSSLAKEVGDIFNKTFEEAILPVLGVPGRDLPQDLSADEYFNLAKHYKRLGWCEQARDALEKTMEVASDQTLADAARRYLKTRIPRMPVPHHAVQKNIQGFNQLARGDVQAALQTFEMLVRDYPDFEWSRGNLGAVYCRLGELDKAEDTLSQALDFNPNYLNGWLHLARLKAAKLDVAEAQRYIDKAIRLDPEDESAKALKQVVEFLSM